MAGMNASTMRLLAAKGLSIEDIIEVAESLEKKADPTNAERQARYRAKRKRNTVTVTGVSPNDIYSNPVPSDEGTRAAPKKSSVPDKPDDVSEPVWNAFAALRRKKGGLSEIALAGIRREAEKAGWPMEAALARCVERNWQGFEAEWVKSTGPPGNANGNYLDAITEKHRREDQARQNA